MYALNFDLNELQKNDNNADVCDGECLLNFMRHVKEAYRQHLHDSQYTVAKGELHSMTAWQCALPETGKPQSVTLTRCSRHRVSWHMTAHTRN